MPTRDMIEVPLFFPPPSFSSIIFFVFRKRLLKKEREKEREGEKNRGRSLPAKLKLLLTGFLVLRLLEILFSPFPILLRRRTPNYASSNSYTKCTTRRRSRVGIPSTSVWYPPRFHPRLFITDRIRFLSDIRCAFRFVRFN